MGVLTIYNSGTSYDEKNKDEIIAKLFARTQGERGKDKIIFAGPGSAAMTNVTYDPTRDSDESQSLIGNDFLTKMFHGIYKKTGTVTGGAKGAKQVQFNVDQALQILKGLPHPKPGLINMAGWSRGACTCHAMANAMQRDKDPWLSSVPVNIFAFDPVPGYSKWLAGTNIISNFQLKDWQTVPGNVANYEAIFMENENRDIMYAAQLEFESTYTKRTLLHLPGKHWFAVEADKEVEEAGLGEVARVGAHLVSEFLEKWGTRFSDRSMIKSDTELLEDYSLMIEHTHDFFKNGGDKIYRWTGNNHTWFKMPNHLLSSSPYFVNVHHKQIFKRVAPKIFTYFFVHQTFDESQSFNVYLKEAGKELQDDPWVFDEIILELASLMGRAPKTYDTLYDFARFVEKPRAKVLQMQQQSPKKKYGNSFASIFANKKIA